MLKLLACFKSKQCSADKSEMPVPTPAAQAKTPINRALKLSDTCQFSQSGLPQNFYAGRQTTNAPVTFPVLLHLSNLFDNSSLIRGIEPKLALYIQQQHKTNKAGRESDLKMKGRSQSCFKTPEAKSLFQNLLYSILQAVISRKTNFIGSVH